LLALSRRKNERIVLEDPAWGYQIEVDVAGVRDGRVRLGFDAPDSVFIWRKELGDFQRRLRAADEEGWPGDAS